MTLFKYCKHEHALGLVERGVIRVGTLLEYRNVDLHGSQRGDVVEGKSTHRFTAKDQTSIDLLASDDSVASFARTVVSGWDNLPKDSSVTLVVEPGGGLIHKTEHSDVYMYCTSTVFDQKTMHDFQCDACVEILEPQLFFEKIGEALGDATGRCIARPVTYAAKDIDFFLRHADNPAFLKPPEYAGQTEFRTIWEPTQLPIEAKMLVLPELTKYCRLR